MHLQEVSFIDLYRNFKSNLKEFEPFLRSTPFVSLQTYDDFEIEENLILHPKSEVLSKEILKYINKETFLIVDLPLDNILDLSLILNNKHFIKPILNLNFLFHPLGLLGERNDISKLIYVGNHLENITPTNYLMLLDYNRFSDFTNKDYEERLNNQYELTNYDLPYGNFLKTLGYKNITYIYENEIKEDMLPCFNYLKESIEVNFIKVG